MLCSVMEQIEMLKRPWPETLLVLPLTPISSRERNTLNFEAGSSPEEGGTPLNWLYRYVRSKRVGFCSLFGHK